MENTLDAIMYCAVMNCVIVIIIAAFVIVGRIEVGMLIPNSIITFLCLHNHRKIRIRKRAC